MSSFVELDKVDFTQIKPLKEKITIEPVSRRPCHFVGFDETFDTPVYDDRALEPGVYIEGPAVVTTVNTSYLVEPNWNYHTSNRGAVWFFKDAEAK